MGFSNRTVIVTGAGGGLGRCYCLEFAKKGANIVINDYGKAVDGTGEESVDRAAEVALEVERLGGRAVISRDNVADEEGGKNIVDLAVKEFGSVDVLINNAGILRDSTIVKMDKKSWDMVVDVHLNGAYNVTKPAFLVMKEQQFGRIIFTASAAGLYGNFGQTNYSAAKLGLVGFMNSLKLEGKKYNVSVNTIAPLAESRMTESLLPPEFLEKMKPEYVAPLVLNLCSESCEVTGEIFNVGMGCVSRVEIKTGDPVSILDESGAVLEEKLNNAVNGGAKSDTKFNDIGAFMLDFMKNI